MSRLKRPLKDSRGRQRSALTRSTAIEQEQLSEGRLTQSSRKLVPGLRVESVCSSLVLPDPPPEPNEVPRQVEPVLLTERPVIELSRQACDLHLERRDGHSVGDGGVSEVLKGEVVCWQDAGLEGRRVGLRGGRSGGGREGRGRDREAPEGRRRRSRQAQRAQSCRSHGGVLLSRWGFRRYGRRV